MNEKVYDICFDHEDGYITFSIVVPGAYVYDQIRDAAFDKLRELVIKPQEWDLNDLWETT